MGHPVPSAPAEPVTRRGFFGRVAMWLSLAASYSTAGVFAARFLYPRKKLASTRSVFISRLTELAEGEARATVDLHGLPLVVIREGQSVRAMSTVCPHLGCRVRWEAQAQRFECPCHSAEFDREGTVLRGPPPRPLDRYEVQIVEGNVFLEMKEPVA